MSNREKDLAVARQFLRAEFGPDADIVEAGTSKVPRGGVPNHLIRSNFNMATDQRNVNQLLNRANVKQLASVIEATTGPRSTEWSEYHEMNLLVDYACEASGKRDQINAESYGRYSGFTLACEWLGLNWDAGKTLLSRSWDDDWLREGEFANQPLTMHPVWTELGQQIWSTVPAEKKIMPYVLRRLARLGWDRNSYRDDFLGGFLLKDGGLQLDEMGFLIWRWHDHLQEGETTTNLMLMERRKRERANAQHKPEEQ